MAHNSKKARVSIGFCIKFARAMVNMSNFYLIICDCSNTKAPPK